MRRLAYFMASLIMALVLVSPVTRADAAPVCVPDSGPACVDPASGVDICVPDPDSGPACVDLDWSGLQEGAGTIVSDSGSAVEQVVAVVTQDECLTNTQPTCLHADTLPDQVAQEIDSTPETIADAEAWAGDAPEMLADAVTSFVAATVDVNGDGVRVTLGASTTWSWMGCLKWGVAGAAATFIGGGNWKQAAANGGIGCVAGGIE